MWCIPQNNNKTNFVKLTVQHKLPSFMLARIVIENFLDIIKNCFAKKHLKELQHGRNELVMLTYMRHIIMKCHTIRRKIIKKINMSRVTIRSHESRSASVRQYIKNGQFASYTFCKTPWKCAEGRGGTTI